MLLECPCCLRHSWGMRKLLPSHRSHMTCLLLWAVSDVSEPKPRGNPLRCPTARDTVWNHTFHSSQLEGMFLHLGATSTPAVPKGTFHVASCVCVSHVTLRLGIQMYPWAHEASQPENTIHDKRLDQECRFTPAKLQVRWTFSPSAHFYGVAHFLLIMEDK